LHDASNDLDSRGWECGAREALPVYIEIVLKYVRNLSKFSPLQRQPAAYFAAVDRFHYQTLQVGVCTMGWPVLQLKAFWNCGMFETTPLMRANPGE
jgi:hypothetical protein